MKKYLLILMVLLTIVGCTKQPAQDEQGQEQQEQQEASNDAIDESSNYIDITGMTLEGTEFSLSEMVGQSDYVLLDFWASWCGPCRRFIPVLRDYYNRFGGDRLEILSCSVDQDERAWREAMNEERLPWQQIREDAKHLCSDKYNVQFIPHTVLIDRHGHIVGVNLEEPELEAILLGN